jgi:hypothetical protein
MEKNMNDIKRLKKEIEKTFKMLAITEDRIKCHYADLELNIKDHHKYERAKKILISFRNNMYKLNNILELE